MPPNFHIWMFLWNVTWHVSDIKQRKLLEVLTEAMEFKPEAFELLGGGSSIPGVRTRASQLKQTEQVAKKDARKIQKRPDLELPKWLKLKINGSTSPIGPNWPPFTVEIFGLGW